MIDHKDPTCQSTHSQNRISEGWEEFNVFFPKENVVTKSTLCYVNGEQAHKEYLMLTLSWVCLHVRMSGVLVVMIDDLNRDSMRESRDYYLGSLFWPRRVHRPYQK